MSRFIYDDPMISTSKYPWEKVLCALSFWITMGLFFRLYGITRESLWWDEYASHVYLNAPSLLEFLSLNRTLDPLSLPAYFTLEYLWTQYVHDSVLSLRLMSVTVGLFTLPFVYDLGRRLYGPWAGFTATGLMAMSPVHVHHSQGIRMYVLFIFLAVLVVWSFIRATETARKRYWLVHGTASVLLYWTHPFALLIPAVISIFLLLRHQWRIQRYWRWCLIQLLLLLPSAVYLSSVRFWPQEATQRWLEHPSFGALLADLFFDDISMFQWQFRFSTIAEKLGNLRLALDIVFTAIIVILLVTWLYRIWTRPQTHHTYNLLLLIWLLLPPIVLFGVSWVIRPCMFPRYTAHCTIPLYVMLSGALHTFQNRLGRILIATSLLAGMMLQWLWLQPGPQRTDWRSAGLFLHNSTTSKDIVLVQGLLTRDVFQHNLEYLTPGPLDAPMAAAETPALLAAQSALCLGMLEQDPPATVWVVIALHYFDPGPPVIYEQLLEQWGIPFQRWFFPAITEIYVYRLKPPVHTQLPKSLAELFEKWDKVESKGPRLPGTLGGYEQEAFGDLALVVTSKGRKEMALQLFDDLFAWDVYCKELFGNVYTALRDDADCNSRIQAVRALWQGFGFRQNGQNAHARRAFLQSVTLDPGHAIAHVELGHTELDMGHYKSAADAFEHAAQLDAQFRVYAHLVEALRHHPEFVPARLKSVRLYRQHILELSQGRLEEASISLQKAVTEDPDWGSAHTSLVFVLLAQRRLDEAQEALNRYFELINPPAPGAFGLQAVLYIARTELDKASECVEKAIQLDPEYGKQFGPLFFAILREKNFQNAIKELDTIKEQGIDLYPLLYEDIKRLLSKE